MHSDTPRRDGPLLSVIVIGYRMPQQLANTLFTLSREYQLEAETLDYEVVVVENASDRCLSADVVAGLPAEFRYFLHEEAGASPAGAINFALAQCRGEYIGLIIDGARMLTPRVLRYAALAYAMDRDSITLVPGYHLGSNQQHEIEDTAQAYEAEAQLLAGIDWKRRGYELFSVATFSPGNPHGFLNPIMECNCLFASRAHFARIGAADMRFQLKGGGAINLHIFRALGMHPDVRVVVLPGEGSFHQYHGGVTTKAQEGREAELRAFNEQLHTIWHQNFHALRREPFLLGAVTSSALPVLATCTSNAMRRNDRLSAQGTPLWQDDRDIANGTFFNPSAPCERTTGAGEG